MARDSRLAQLPRVLLWAWERPIRFSALPPSVGIAYLAGTLVLSDHEGAARPRFQPLVIPSSAPVVAVVRVEIDAKRGPTLTDQQAQWAAESVLALASRPRVIALQVDFDATSGERCFYSTMLARLRRVIPARWPLSITALASWCMGDPWIRDLPIDEAVPMLFRMGPDSRGVRARLDAGQDFSLDVCRTSLGLSLDEPLARVPQGRRRYVFSADGWNEHSIAQALRLSEPAR